MLRPLCDEMVGDGVLGGQPQGRGVASPGQGLHLQGSADIMETEPARILQFGVVDVQLGDRWTELTGDLLQPSKCSPDLLTCVWAGLTSAWQPSMKEPWGNGQC